MYSYCRLFFFFRHHEIIFNSATHSFSISFPTFHPFITLYPCLDKAYSQSTVTKTVCYVFFARRVCLPVSHKESCQTACLACQYWQEHYVNFHRSLAGFQILYSCGNVESVRCLIEGVCRHLLGLSEQNYGTAWDSRCPQKYSKPVPPECKSRLLPRC